MNQDEAKRALSELGAKDVTVEKFGPIFRVTGHTDYFPVVACHTDLDEAALHVANAVSQHNAEGYARAARRAQVERENGGEFGLQRRVAHKGEILGGAGETNIRMQALAGGGAGDLGGELAAELGVDPNLGKEANSNTGDVTIRNGVTNEDVGNKAVGDAEAGQ